MSGPETRIQRAIQKMVKSRGGFVFKVHGSETMMAGLPDLVVCYKGYFIAFEVKTPVGKLSERQRYVHRMMSRAEAIVAVPTSVAEASAVLDDVDTWCDAN
jgi:Holliday junction resolvase